MIASEKRVSLLGNNVDFQTNDNSTVIKLTPPPQINSKKKVEDGEIGIFGAEKYFKGAMDEELPRTPHATIKPANYHPKQPHDYVPEPPKPKTKSATSSVRSESSWNSRSGLLVHGGNRRFPRSKTEKPNSVKSLLASIGCNCNDKGSVKIAGNRGRVKEPVKPPVKPPVKAADFAFPVLNTFPVIKTGVPEEEINRTKTRRNSPEVFNSPILEKGKKSFSLERKLTMLNWDGVTPIAENIGNSNNDESNDAGSDASSDLFEIESFSTTGNNSFLARQVSNANGYAPSEASIAWSVVTASYENCRTSVNDNIPIPTSRNVKGGGEVDRVVKGSGILSGCNSHKSVRVAGEHLVVSGGEKAVSAAVKERCRLDSVVPIVKLQGETKAMSSLPGAHSRLASHHLYIQRQ